MRDRRKLSAALVPLLTAALASACQPVPVRVGETALADVGLPPVAEPAVNLVAIGVAAEGQPIVLRTTGVRLERGSTVMLGVAGPGVEPGALIAVVGTGFDTRVVRFGVTQGGGQPPMPAAVLSVTIGDSVSPGLYTLLAARSGQVSLFTGGVEVD